MATILALATVFAFVGVLAAFANTRQVKRIVSRLPATEKLPQAITLLLFIAEVTELSKTIEHLSVMSIIVAAVIFTIAVAIKSGSDSPDRP